MNEQELANAQFYFNDNGTQSGPVSAAKLKNKFTAMQVFPHTLIWCQGMAEWQPISQVFPDWAAAAPANQAKPGWRSPSKPNKFVIFLKNKLLNPLKTFVTKIWSDPKKRYSALGIIVVFFVLLVIGINSLIIFNSVKTQESFCEMKLRSLRSDVLYYREDNGRLPEEFGVEGLKKILSVAPNINDAICPGAKELMKLEEKPIPVSIEELNDDNASYFYFGGSHIATDQPIIMDIPGNHGSTFAFIRADGSYVRMKKPSEDTLAACLKAALGHEPATDQEKQMLKAAEDWDRRHMSRY